MENPHKTRILAFIIPPCTENDDPKSPYYCDSGGPYNEEGYCEKHNVAIKKIEKK